MSNQKLSAKAGQLRGDVLCNTWRYEMKAVIAFTVLAASIVAGPCNVMANAGSFTAAGHARNICRYEDGVAVVLNRYKPDRYSNLKMQLFDKNGLLVGTVLESGKQARNTSAKLSQLPLGFLVHAVACTPIASNVFSESQSGRLDLACADRRDVHVDEGIAPMLKRLFLFSHFAVATFDAIYISNVSTHDVSSAGSLLSFSLDGDELTYVATSGNAPVSVVRSLSHGSHIITLRSYILTNDNAIHVLNEKQICFVS